MQKNPLVPAKAGTPETGALDSRFRGNERISNGLIQSGAI
jgi:hypothetical protein